MLVAVARGDAAKHATAPSHSVRAQREHELHKSWVRDCCTTFNLHAATSSSVSDCEAACQAITIKNAAAMLNYTSSAGIHPLTLYSRNSTALSMQPVIDCTVTKVAKSDENYRQLNSSFVQLCLTYNETLTLSLIKVY